MKDDSHSVKFQLCFAVLLDLPVNLVKISYHTIINVCTVSIVFSPKPKAMLVFIIIIMFTGIDPIHKFYVVIIPLHRDYYMNYYNCITYHSPIAL